MLKTLVLLSILSAAPTADPISGTWEITGDVMGYPLHDVCTLQQNGTALSGTCTFPGGKPSAVTGEAKDGKFTFKHTVEGENGISTLVFSGTAASPTELKGTLTVQEHDITADFTARPAAAK